MEAIHHIPDYFLPIKRKKKLVPIPKILDYSPMLLNLKVLSLILEIVHFEQCDFLIHKFEKTIRKLMTWKLTILKENF